MLAWSLFVAPLSVAWKRHMTSSQCCMLTVGSLSEAVPADCCVLEVPCHPAYPSFSLVSFGAVASRPLRCKQAASHRASSIDAVVTEGGQVACMASMRLLLLLAVLGWSDQAWAISELGDDDAVLTLTEDSFQHAISSNTHVLAEFYAPWCGHCQKLAPNYAKAAAQLKSEGADVVLAKVDATVESALASKYGVSSYPTLKWFVNGTFVEYRGPRDAEGIVQWVQKKVGAATVKVLSASVLTELETNRAAIVVGYFDGTESHAYSVFQTVAKDIDDVTFVETTSKEVAEAAGLTAPGFAMVKNFKDQPRSTAVFEVTPEAVGTWVNTEKKPSVIVYSNENLELIFRSGVDKQVLIWGTAKELAAGNTVMDTFKAVAPKFKGKVVFMSVDTETSLSKKITTKFGLTGVKPPVVAGMYMAKGKEYMMDMKNFSKTALEGFAQGVIDGTAPEHHKSQPIPEDPKDGEVTVVVGRTVDTLVFDESKDVLLEVYAPWCGHCKNLEPIYKQLAERFKQVDSVVIAKMDGTENSHTQIQADGYPTLLFKPAGKGSKLMRYSGDRTLEDLTKYIKENAKISFALPGDNVEEEQADEETVKKGVKVEL